MHHIKKSIHNHIELFAVITFIIISATILSITLFLINQNQDTRSRAASGTCTVDSAISLDTQEQQFLTILNNHRASIGRGPLRASLTLTKAAQWQTEDMIQNNYRSHTDSLGRSAQQRLASCGIGGSTGGENIVWARTSAQHAFDGWLASPGHKANMEHAAYTQIGIARMSEGNNRSVWVNTFSSGNDGTSPVLDVPITPSNTPIPPTTTPIQTISPTPTTPVNSCTSNSTVFYAHLKRKPGLPQNVKPEGITRIALTNPQPGVGPDYMGYEYITTFSEVPQTPINQIRISTENSEGPLSNPPIENPESDHYYMRQQTIDQMRSGEAFVFVTTSEYPNGELTGEITCTPPAASPTPTPSPTPTTTPPEGSKTVKYSFKIAGIGNNTQLGENTTPKWTSLFLIMINDAGNIISLPLAAYNSTSSLFEGQTNIKEEFLETTDNLQILLPGALIHPVKITDIQDNTIPQFSFITGDINIDDAIDLNDFIDMVACIKNIRCDSTTVADLNSDDKIDSVDLNIILNRFFQGYR